ncbi:MAG: hypothetical protein ACTTH7_00745 [Treponema sp.]
MKNKKIFIAVCSLFCILWSAFTDSEPVELVSDPLKLVIYPKTGNFCVYRTDASRSGFYTPLYDDRTQSSLNVYSLLFNGHIYHLNNRSGKKIIIEQAKSSITVTFQISLDFIAVQHFSFEKTNGLTTGPMLKVVTEVQNISGAVADIALKAVFDTSFAETYRIPFYTDIRTEIGSELLLQPALEKDTVIFSADKGCSTMFFLKGVHQTTPVSVFIANWERLITKTWLPSYVQGRSFKKASARDPGILYVWSERKVANKQFFSISNCIGFYDYRSYRAPSVPTVYTSHTNEAAGTSDETHADRMQEDGTPLSALENAASDTVMPAASSLDNSVQDTQLQKESPKEPVMEEQNAAESTADMEKHDADEAHADMERQKAQSYEKIEKLLEQIKQLEQNPSEVSQEEIHALQEEVDAIIQILQEE